MELEDDEKEKYDEYAKTCEGTLQYNISSRCR